MRSAGLRRMPTMCVLSASILVGGSLAASTHEVGEPAPSQASTLAIASHPSLAVIKTAPNFTLIDTANRPVALSQLQGRVVLLSFIYTTCITTCPLLTHRMTILLDDLKDAGLWPDKVSFLSVTVDPERDTAKILSEYAENFHAVDPNWRFLRDAPERLRPILAAYGEWTRPLPDGELDHPARVYLIDGRGDVREVYALAFFDERQAFIDIKSLLGEHR